MRELNTAELNEVSGAGAITDAGTALGKGIGSILDAVGIKGGKEAATDMGTGVGQVVEVSANIVSSIFGSLFGKKR